MADDESSMVGRQHGPHCTQSWSPVLHRYGPDKVQCGQQSSSSHKAGFLLCSQWQSIFHTPPLPLSYCQQYCCQHGLAHLQDTLLWLAPVCLYVSLLFVFPLFCQHWLRGILRFHSVCLQIWNICLLWIIPVFLLSYCQLFSVLIYKIVKPLYNHSRVENVHTRALKNWPEFVPLHSIVRLKITQARPQPSADCGLYVVRADRSNQQINIIQQNTILSWLIQGIKKIFCSKGSLRALRTRCRGNHWCCRSKAAAALR